MSTRVAVVTGSNKGIGLATVRALCKEFEGDVYLTARNVLKDSKSTKETNVLFVFHLQILVCVRLCVLGRVVNVSSMNCVSGLKKCSPDLQQRFRNENITEEELVELMQRFVDEAKKGEHKERGWTDGAYTVSKIGLTVLSVIHARRLTKERPNDGILLNACCPGWVRTDMAGPTAPKSPDEGAVTPVYLALLPSGAKEPHGKYLSDKEVQPW
ncbi:carbonyl reductase [NADPH] 1-like [Neolamprologus brichardi]|uniref:carbonyl reductase [NADPH] 1-like n=1 Tax=Neolamprologus brichardi TaxID=32507 RepID=UPI001643C5B9|nr:carbonyl reductase [NADPH] 1-like [Neolamprologus brichardi]